MRALLLVLIALTLGACASKPPLPPECEGDLVPINATKAAAQTGGHHEARRGG